MVGRGFDTRPNTTNMVADAWGPEVGAVSRAAAVLIIQGPPKREKTARARLSVRRLLAAPNAQGGRGGRLDGGG